MDLPNILNNKGPAAAAAEQQLQQQLAEATNVNGRTLSETGSERGLSPHMSDRSMKYPSRPDQALHNISAMTSMPQFADTHLMNFSLVTNPYPTPTGSYDNGYNHSTAGEEHGGRMPMNGENASQVKAFACSNCGKGFARRSDLARHERIHTGVRPHVCDYPGCNKQFIQRSALTVHARVHTGEKPHMCEHCTKPFSDSSSLARHRRIHSGKRPYKCPYADCQKTFTRRTTLTRHQSHHTGTVEEAAVATAAALASRPPNHSQRTQSDGGTYSEAGSARNTPSPGHRGMTASPSGEMPQAPLLPRHSNDFSFMASRPLPPHMRSDLQQHSPRSSPGSASPALSNFGGNHHRPSLTSHPTMYGPPPTLEPPTHQDHRSPGSTAGSPHLSSMGWQSPTQLGSPAPTENYLYPEPSFGVPGPPLYYPSSNMRRPQSTEPNDYETNKPRLVGGELWAGHM